MSVDLIGIELRVEVVREAESYVEVADALCCGISSVGADIQAVGGF